MNLGFRVDDLAGGCTVVEVAARAELVAIDFVGRHASLLRAVDLTAALRGRGVPQTRLDLGPVAIVADSIGVVAQWTAASGFGVQLRTPGLAAEIEGRVVPLALPIGANWKTSAFDDVENLVGVLGASNPYGWLHDLVDLLGWTLTGHGQPHRLALSALATDPGTALRDWIKALLTDEDVLGRISAALARVLTGSTGGLAGAIVGRGTPADPWVVPLGRTAAGPALTFAFGPDGPRLAPSMTSTMLQGWRPALPGLPPAGLAQSILDEAGAGDDIAALVRGRADLAAGFGDLALRVLNTDVLVAPPPAALDGVDVQVHPGATYAGWAAFDLTEALGGPAIATAAVIRVAVATPATSPWPAAPADRVLDLSAAALPPESFTVAAPDAGEWFVLLGGRAGCSLGSTDPSGVLGQAARLGRVIGALGAGRPVVVVAVGGAGHAARVAADAQGAVTNLVTLGTPWSPVAFDAARNGASASALRLLKVLLTAPDPAEPDDADLALGRAIVGGLLDAGTQLELEAPRPTMAVRAGLTVRAWFGGLERPAVDRAFTAIVAAGLAQRAQARAATNGAPATSVGVALRIPVDVGPPPAGHGIVVDGHVELGLLAVDFAAKSIGADLRVRAHLAIADSDSWLIGGPGTTPGDGAAPLELRWIEATVDVGLGGSGGSGGGSASAATLILHEVAALGASRDRLVVRPNVTATGTIEDSPFLPEARAVVAALITKLRAETTGTATTAAAGSAASAVLALLDGIGLSTTAGLVPDALSHLLHDPAAFLAPVLAGAQGVGALADALVALVPGASRSGQTVAITSGPATFSIDLAGRRVGVTAASAVGALPWQLDLAGVGGPSVTGSVTIGSPAFNGAGVRFGLAPFTAALVRETATGAPNAVALWPNPDTDGLASFALAALPAEAIRLVLDGVRGLDTTLAGQIDALAGAIGMLGVADANGARPIIAAVALFDDPGGWFRHHVLGVTPAEQLDRVIDLFEALKPFVGLAGTPRGTWPIVAGVTLQVTGGATGASIAVALDATAWLGGVGRVPFAAGVVLGLTMPATGAPTPAVELFVGIAETTPSAEHRRAVHVLLDAGGLRALLRPTAGADIPLFPGAAGLGRLLESATVDLLLPLVLNELAKLSGSPTRDQVAALTAAIGTGLDLVTVPTTSPVTFDGAKLHDLADHPATKLAAQATALLTHAVAALHPLLQQLPGAPSAVMSGTNLVITVRGTTLTVTPSPLRIAVAGSVAGIPVIGGASASFAADARGLRAWSFGIGPAVFDLDGPKLRPVLRGGRDEGAGWEVGLGLALDDIAVGTAGHKELFGRWRESDGLAIVARTRGATANDDVTDPATVATFAADAVLELLGNYVIALPELVTLLDKTVNGTTVRALLQGSILADADGHKLRAAPVSSLPGSLFVLARKLAGALPALALGPDDALELALAETDGVIGLRLNVKDPNKGLALNQGGDTLISLVSDASWIAPPTGGAPPAGIVVGIVSISNDAVPVVTVKPGIAANGIGVRIAKSSGPLLDAGLRLDAVAIHLFGSLQSNGTGGVDVSGGVHLELDGLAVPLGSGGGTNAVAQGVMNDAAGSGSPPTPKFSPAIAVQSHHGGNGVAVSLSAGTGDGPWYLPIRRAFGPVYLEQIGLGTGYAGNTPRTLDWISLSLDGSVSLFGITASVDKLRLTYHVNKPFFDVKSWEVDLDGFAIASSIGGLTLAGALIRAPLTGGLQGVEYLGMLKIGFSGYGLDLFGGYAHPTDGNGSFASFFAFGALHAPLGGVPAFFITGIGLGLGINRELKPPNMDTITSNPFLVAMKALGPAPDPKAELEQMRASMAPKRGEYWVAAGISFTSFVLISGEIVLTIAFGDGLEITLLGLARAELPVPGAALVSIELALMARFSSTEGVVIVQAQLTENSWLLMPSVRLTGGFAFATWWKGPNAGQFVVTMGGYHPSFNHPGYPNVPRLGLRWQPIENISIVGESYFALCSEAIMAGISIEVSAHFGPAHARLSIGADGIVFFDPFFFRVRAWAEINAGIRIWVLFGTIDIELNFGAAVDISGPPIHVSGHFTICGFEVPFEFGEEANPADSALTAVQFRDKYLRAGSDAQVIQASVVKGSVTAGKNTDGSPRKVPDGSAANPFLLIPEFQLVVISTAPAVDMALQHQGEADKTMRVAAPELGVAPMYSHTLASNLHVALSKVGAPANALSIAAVTVAARARAAFPKGVWGEAPVVNAPKVPAGETIDASDGFTISTVLADPAGAKPIDYHQVELPFGGRKPLPFVTNRTLTDSRLVAAGELRALADAFRPAATDRNGRFNVAARLLDAGGYGAVGVAALRGERAAVPVFGSLADDMVAAPAAVSTTVAATVVDRTKATARFVAPIFKAVLGGPLTLAANGSQHTHVARPGAAVAATVPTIDGVRGAVSKVAPASLLLQARRATVVGRTLGATAVAPVTRLATSTVGAVVNASPDRASAARLTAMSTSLANGAAVHDGEVAVLAVASRPAIDADQPDRLVISGGATRVITLAAGGNVLFDNVVGATADGQPATVDVPWKTERIVIVGLGALAGVGGSLDGWYAGQSLPSVGWDIAIAAGAVVTFANNKVAATRERNDGGWANTRELARASQVVTRFDNPSTARCPSALFNGAATRSWSAAATYVPAVSAGRIDG
ncbi:MAG: DUF6603 domain-containing protein [Ilumatobacteraceae bacterium]